MNFSFKGLQNSIKLFDIYHVVSSIEINKCNIYQIRNPSTMIIYKFTLKLFP